MLEKNTIPRSIIQYWDRNVPQDVQVLMKTWQEYNPGYKYELYDDDRVVSFLANAFDPAVLAAYKSCALPEMKADLFRYAVLYKLGGFYIDADESCISPIEDVIDLEAELVTYKRPLNNVWSIGFIGCVPEHPVLEKTLCKAVCNIQDKISNNMWLVTGNPVFSGFLDSYLSECPDNKVKTYTISDYKRIAKLHFDGLEYKSNHWSIVQKSRSIFSG